MSLELIVRQRARKDLNSIYDFIAEDSRERALSFTEMIEERFQMLRDFPKLGRARDDLVPGLRTLPIERKVVVAYTIIPTGVAIERVFYGGRDFEVLMAGG